MKAFLTIITLLFSSLALAQDIETEDSVGIVNKFTGKVLIQKDGSPRGVALDASDYPLHLKDILRTKRRSQAFLTLADKSKVILDQRSTLSFAGMNSYDLSESKGKVIFNIYKKDRIEGVKIKAKNAIIGVKGTTFAVDVTNGGFNLYMKDGTVSVDSLKGEFEHYKKSQMDEFQRYQQQYMSEFEKYKSQMQKEFREYVNSLSVSGGDSISVVGNKVVHIETPRDVKKLFSELDSF